MPIWVYKTIIGPWIYYDGGKIMQLSYGIQLDGTFKSISKTHNII